MDKRQILKKLEELYNIQEVKEGFSSQQACIDWANKVAPLLKFNNQYYYNFLQNAHKINLPLSSYTLGPALKVMMSQVQMAIEELKLATDDKESNMPPREHAGCGPLAKDACDLDNSIKKEFLPQNIFLDIPYTNYEDCEKALREILAIFGLQPIVAKDRLTSNAVLCKVCKLIKTCKYGIADISSGSNSVSYEYGLMHGLGMKVCLLLRSESEKFTDIHGLEHLSYDGIRKFKITIAKWMLDNVIEVPKETIEKFLKSEDAALHKEGEIPLKKIKIVTDSLPEIDIILNDKRKHFGSSSGGGRKGYYDIGYALSFRIRNKSNINVCLEDVVLENELLGKGKLDKSNSRLSRLPFNIGPRMTEELNLFVKFPNEMDEDIKGTDIKLEVRFEFADRVVTKELIGFIS